MSKALFVSSTEDVKTAELFDGIGVDKVVCAHTCGEARRAISSMDFDVILINAPLKDENGVDLALHAAENTYAGIMILVKNQFADAVQSRVEHAGVGVMGKPAPAVMVAGAIRLLIAMHNRYVGMMRENNDLRNKLEEMKVVSRAKIALMTALHMSENQAHKYIERQAMDLRITKRAVAERILKTYE